MTNGKAIFAERSCDRLQFLNVRRFEAFSRRGPRFGWVPPDQPAGEPKSITWLECERASAEGMEVLAFLIDDKQPWPEDAREEYALAAAAREGRLTPELVQTVPRNLNRLRAFKTWLDSRGLRASFTTPDDLRAKVVLALNEWREVVLLLGGVLHEQGRPKVDGLIAAAITDLGKKPKLADQARAAGLLGAVLHDLAPLGYEATDARYPRLPDHNVKLDEFEIGKYPVTVADYEPFVEHGGYEDEKWWEVGGGFAQFPAPDNWEQQLAYPNRPVVGVSWFEAVAYAAWAGCRLRRSGSVRRAGPALRDESFRGATSRLICRG